MGRTKNVGTQEVRYCRRCVMSSTRPSSSPEFRRRSFDDVPHAAFNSDGICHACDYASQKSKIDWGARETQLGMLLDRFRERSTSAEGYDVLVPGSGGKDSIMVAHLLKNKFGMNPLLCTWAPHEYTEVGLENLLAFQQLGIDHVLFTPNPEIHRLFTRAAFTNLLNPFQPFIVGQKVFAPKLAARYGIKLVMYGENPAEAHNSAKELVSSMMSPKHFSSKDQVELFFGGVSEKAWKEKYGFSKQALDHYRPMSAQLLQESGVEVHFMSHFMDWSPQANYFYAAEHSSFRSNPLGRSEGTYSKYSSLDDKIDGQHYFTMLIKYGQGRAMNDACRDIRDEIISRDDGVRLVHRYDTEFPKKHFGFFLDYLDLEESRYWELIDAARPSNLWTRSGGTWELTERVAFGSEAI